MPNNASHLADKQALQRQNELFLPLVTKALSKLGYLNLVHQRLSKQTGIEPIYQGLTRATDNKLEPLMIKWEISADIYYDLTSLGQEIKVLKSLNSLQCKAQNSINISPIILADNYSIITLLNKKYQLTLLVMPYYSKGSLAKYLKQSLTDDQKHQLIIKAAELIKSLHAKGWLHNDIKPSNILINEEHDLLLTDFALAEPIKDSDKDKINAKNSAGTPAYLAPERWQGQGTSMQSNVYAFGIMLYEILVGERPYAIESSSNEPLRDWALQHCQQPIPKLPSEHSRYQVTIDKALAKRVEERYLDMEGVLEGLESI